MVQRCIPNSVEIGVVLESALVGQFVDSQEGRTSEQIADLIGGLFQMQECYTQQELVKALQDQWKTEGKGKPPGRDRLRELIAEQVDQSISQQSESGKYVYRWLAQ